MQSNDALKARAESVFKVVETTLETRATAAGEYRAKQEAEIEKMARLRAARLAAQGKR